MQTAAGNVAKMEEMEARLQKKVEAMDLDALEADPQLESHGVCSVTLQNYVDALRDADCLCLALDVSRPEAAIAGAPSRNHERMTCAVMSLMGSSPSILPHGFCFKHSAAAFCCCAAQLQNCHQQKYC